MDVVDVVSAVFARLANTVANTPTSERLTTCARASSNNRKGDGLGWMVGLGRHLTTNGIVPYCASQSSQQTTNEVDANFSMLASDAHVVFRHVFGG